MLYDWWRRRPRQAPNKVLLQQAFVHHVGAIVIHLIVVSDELDHPIVHIRSGASKPRSLPFRKWVLIHVWELLVDPQVRSLPRSRTDRDYVAELAGVVGTMMRAVIVNRRHSAPNCHGGAQALVRRARFMQVTQLEGPDSQWGQTVRRIRQSVGSDNQQGHTWSVRWQFEDDSRALSPFLGPEPSATM